MKAMGQSLNDEGGKFLIWVVSQIECDVGHLDRCWALGPGHDLGWSGLRWVIQHTQISHVWVCRKSPEQSQGTAERLRHRVCRKRKMRVNPYMHLPGILILVSQTPTSVCSVLYRVVLCDSLLSMALWPPAFQKHVHAPHTC